MKKNSNNFSTFAVIHVGCFGWGGVRQTFGGQIFRGSERNITIGQSPKIWGNFSKLCNTINKI